MEMRSRLGRRVKGWRRSRRLEKHCFRPSTIDTTAKSAPQRCSQSRLRERHTNAKTACIGLAIGGALLASTAITAASHGAPLAAEGWDRCPDAHACLFEHADGQGRMAMFRAGARGSAERDLRRLGFENQASSAYNRGSWLNLFCLYDDPNGQGDDWAVRVGEKVNLTQFNDRTESVKVTSVANPGIC